MMELKFIYEKHSIANDTYIISLKSSRKVQRAIKQFYPTQIISIPQSWAGESQGFSLDQILNKQFKIQIPTVSPEDTFSFGQHQADISNLTKQTEKLIQDFMKNSAICRYSDSNLVIIKIDRTYQSQVR